MTFSESHDDAEYADQQTPTERATDDRGPSVAFQGVAGAFGEEAIIVRWKATARALARPSFDAVVQCVATRAAAFGVVPICNSITGHIAPGRAAIARGMIAGTLVVAEEIDLPIRQHLLACSGTELRGVRYVASHPVAFAQCVRFLARHPHMRRVDASNTAIAAWQLARLAAAASPDALPFPANDDDVGDSILPGVPWWARVDDGHIVHSLAAVAGEAAARRYGLAILARDIHEPLNNVTRFAVIARREAEACV